MKYNNILPRMSHKLEKNGYIKGKIEKEEATLCFRGKERNPVP